VDDGGHGLPAVIHRPAGAPENVPRAAPPVVVPPATVGLVAG